ncbi:MAG: hypothetical protein HY000_11775 [Planctomycetes bacterium]|nr:hypothetical protein [Planctomycetota bacterium]
MRLNFFRPLWSLSDHEVVDRTRRSIAQFEHARPWLVLLYCLILAAYVWVWTMIIQVLVGLGQQPNAPPWLLALVAGIPLGMMMGWMVHGVSYGLFMILVGLRTERLLVKYYDALVAIAEKHTAATPDISCTGNRLLAP